MANHIENRDQIIQFLREELVGPSPQGEAIKCQGEIKFSSNEQFYRCWKQENGEEILQRDPPIVRYGVGVLYPFGVSQNDDTSKDDNLQEVIDEQTSEELIDEKVIENLEKIKEDIANSKETELDDFDLSSANAYKPSSMGVSFLGEFPDNSKLVVTVSGGYYHQKKLTVTGNQRTWWLRKPFEFTVEFSGDYLKEKSGTLTQLNTIDGINLSVEIFSRPDTQNRENTRLLTVCLVNRTQGDSQEKSIFQTRFEVTIIIPNKESCILPYSGQNISFDRQDEEEQSLALLYRDLKTYAVGHGCAANWDEKAINDRVKTVIADCFPLFETPSITPDIKREDGTAIEVSMATLAGLIKGEDGFSALEEVVKLYQQWIETKRAEINNLKPEYHEAATRHLDECERASQRMKQGLTYLQNNHQAKLAFQLANHAILLQQISSSQTVRNVSFDDKAKRFNFAQPYQKPNPNNLAKGRGKWRAFQIAFLLMSLESTAEGNIPERETVELIWFPTGGGKTEAYLGLSAFALFMRRLKNPNDLGTHILMRYTLRLLTAQQFQRASALICAMEYLRRQDEKKLGKVPFSIGIWLGSSTTPNTRQSAIQQLNQLNRNSSAENPFIISQCPWCNAQMGRWYQGKKPAVLGYQQSAGTVIFKCSDNACEFHQKLPIYVIDEDIYQDRPSLVIGTVDKFAQLAWKPEARALFGINQDGSREYSPPGLIIQDELHLISGPLGSMVGLYETVIEELCTDRRNQKIILPKIVCSTATIRRYKHQIKALYGRDDVVLFPPPGLDISDSFFSRYAKKEDGTLERGRIYLGINAVGLGSLLSAQVRTSASILQAPVTFNIDERDPWWTLLMFFNNLKDLGYSLSLFQSDIPEYLKVIKNRLRLDWQQLRRLWNILELTGRIRSDQVPQAIAKLEIKTDNPKNQYPIDICLASNIIEVGVDIDRLSLMSVISQPKTTSQYIQVTGRVGRRWWERPGLILMLYSPTKPRDRSHFEKFRSYHEKLYAQVEPTSVTPFSPPVLDRALHAIMAAYVRQLGDEKIVQSPDPYPDNLIENLREILIPRITAIDPDELDNFQKVFNQRAKQWQNWQRTHWELKTANNNDIPLIRAAGSYATREQARLSWETPTSMRNVDAECQAEITHLYLLEDSEETNYV
jgi:hypothetical protein